MHGVIWFLQVEATGQLEVIRTPKEVDFLRDTNYHQLGCLAKVVGGNQRCNPVAPHRPGPGPLPWVGAQSAPVRPPCAVLRHWL